MQPSAQSIASHASRQAPAHRDPPPSRRFQRHKRLLTRASKNPRTALRDRRCLKEPFLSDFFDLCDDKALVLPYPDPASEPSSVGPPSVEPITPLDYAQVALELAERTGDRCRMHRAHGIHVHALIAASRRADAAEELAEYRVSALACCPTCASDWHLRQADLAVESFNPTAAGSALDLSLEHLGPEATPDQRARRCFIRGIQHQFKGRHGRALDDATTVLRDLDLTSPQGYFLDTLGFIACFLQHSRDPSHDQQALAALKAFRQRLLSLENFTAVRTRMAWVEGQIHARLCDWRRAHSRLGKTQKDLAQTAPPKQVLAVGLDRCQLYAGRPNDATKREILRTLKYYKTILDLEPLLKKRLKEVIKVISSKPRYTLDALTMFRQSFIVPVPGIVVRMR